MNRYMVYIIASVGCLIVPVIGVLYGDWDHYQPKLGAVGNGNSKPTLLQVLPMLTCFLLGAINLPIAIAMYRRHKG